MKAAVLIAATLFLAPGCEEVTPLPATVDASVLTGWTVIPAGTANLNAVSGVSDVAVWVVGDRGTIGHWNGTQLTFEQSGTNVTLRGVSAIDTDQAYAVGDQGTILQRKQGVWKQVGAGTSPQALTSVYADSQRVVAVGSFGTVVFGTPSAMTATYKLVPNSNSENLLGVSGTPGGVITAVGALGIVLQVNAGGVSRVNIPAFSEHLAGTASSSAATYFVGQLGSVYRSNGAGPTAVTGCPLSSLRAVSTTATATWIVGWDGTVCEISGTKATSYPYSDLRWFNGVYAASATSLWVVGASGTLLHGLPKTSAPTGSGP